MSNELRPTDRLLDLARDEKADIRERIKAAIVLDELGRRDKATYILLAIARGENRDSGIHIEATEALGKLGLVAYLLSLATDEKVVRKVRQKAVEVLGELRQADDLLALARDERIPPSVRRKTAEALGKLGQRNEAIPILLGFAHDEKVDTMTRVRAVVALKWLGDVQILPHLEAITHQDLPEELCRAIHKAIEKIVQQQIESG